MLQGGFPGDAYDGSQLVSATGSLRKAGDVSHPWASREGSSRSGGPFYTCLSTLVSRASRRETTDAPNRMAARRAGPRSEPPKNPSTSFYISTSFYTSRRGRFRSIPLRSTSRRRAKGELLQFALAVQSAQCSHSRCQGCVGILTPVDCVSGA